MFDQAIMEVGEVLQFYDADRHFPAWGFGGRPYNGSVSHCFDLSPNGYEVRRPSSPSLLPFVLFDSTKCSLK